jgi:hypothetical protein
VAAGKTSGPPSKAASFAWSNPDDIIDKMTYTLSNPVKDGLVEKAHHWPGVTSLDAITPDRPLVASRPKHFFRDKEGPMPEVVSLVFARPHGFKDLAAKAFAERVRERAGRRGDRCCRAPANRSASHGPPGGA